MPKDRKIPKTRKRLKSSVVARRLIRYALERYKTERAAARALGLPNHGQLNQMRRGLIGDTPAMKAAIARAKERARRAYHFIPPDRGHIIDRAELQVIVEQLKRLLVQTDTPPP